MRFPLRCSYFRSRIMSQFVEKKNVEISKMYPLKTSGVLTFNLTKI